MWWIYFVIPCGELLHAYRERSFGWGYGHIPLFGAIVAVGAGLHVAAYFLEHHSELSATGTLLTVAIPVSIYLLGLYLLYAALTRTIDPFHLLLIALTGVVVAVAVVLSAAGASSRHPARARPGPVGDRGRLRSRRAPPQRRGAGRAARALRLRASRARPRGRGSGDRPAVDAQHERRARRDVEPLAVTGPAAPAGPRC